MATDTAYDESSSSVTPEVTIGSLGSSNSINANGPSFVVDLIKLRKQQKYQESYEIINTLFIDNVGISIVKYLQHFADNMFPGRYHLSQMFTELTSADCIVLTELATIWFYIDELSGKHKLCLLLCDYLLIANHDLLPNTYNTYIHSLYQWYCQQLVVSSEYSLHVDMPNIENGFVPYLCLNPSIVKMPDGQYLVNVRGGGWSQQHGSNYRSLGNTNVVYSINMLAVTGNDFDVSSSQKLIVNRKGPKFMSPVRGFEDCRLLIHNDQVYFVCSDRESTQATNYQTLIGTINLDTMTTSPSVRMTAPPGLGYNNEKNWLPFSHNDRILAIYDYNPLTVIEINEQTGNTTIYSQDHHPLFNLYKFRGSAGPVRMSAFNIDGWLAMVHEVIYEMNGNYVKSRKYLHRFVFMDDNFMLIGISSIFYFDRVDIEFCLSMIIDDDDTLKIGVGIDDSEAKLVVCQLTDIEQMLYKL